MVGSTNTDLYLISQLPVHWYGTCTNLKVPSNLDLHRTIQYGTFMHRCYNVLNNSSHTAMAGPTSGWLPYVVVVVDFVITCLVMFGVDKFCYL